MSGGLRLVAGERDRVRSEFEVVFVSSEGAETRIGLADCAAVDLEAVAPVRRIPSYRRQRNNTGYYWSATTGAHVEFESWLERDEAMALDFDPSVTGYAAQPFWLRWSEGGLPRSHAPDFFARRTDGAGVVVDCRPANRVKPRDEESFAAAERACAVMGWQYRRVADHDPVWLANVRWLAGYRHPRHRRAPMDAALDSAFAEPCRLIDGARSVGDPIAVLPVLFHLLWTGVLVVDLAERLEATSVVTAVAR